MTQAENRPTNFIRQIIDEARDAHLRADEVIRQELQRA